MRRDQEIHLANYGERFDSKIDEIHKEINGIHKEIGGVREGNKFTQLLVLNAAVMTMKAIDGDKKEMREFVANAAKFLRCVELGKDCAKEAKALV